MWGNAPSAPPILPIGNALAPLERRTEDMIPDRSRHAEIAELVRVVVSRVVQAHVVEIGAGPRPGDESDSCGRQPLADGDGVAAAQRDGGEPRVNQRAENEVAEVGKPAQMHVRLNRLKAMRLRRHYIRIDGEWVGPA